MEAQCLPAIHTNGVESKNLLEKSPEIDLKSEESKEKTGKSLPGPIQRGPQRRINNSQVDLFQINFHADSSDSTASSASASSAASTTSRNSRDSLNQRGRVEKNLPGPIQRGPQRRRSTSQASTGSTSSNSSATSRNSTDSVKQSGVDHNDQEGQTAEGEDTMKNLRTTFAGIFGESRLK